jgi:hypothetical protein
MKYTHEQLIEAVKENIFSQEQVNRFEEYLKSRNNTTKFQKILYYGGGWLIISAMTWLMASHWNSFGSFGLTAICTMYFVVFSTLGWFVFFRKKLETAGGILFSVPIAITPLLVFSVLKGFNFWSGEFGELSYGDYYLWIRGKWIVLEISTILIALPILWKTKFPFHIFLISGSLWFFSMDIVPIIYEEAHFSWTQRALVSEIFGIGMILIGYLADVKFQKDYSFWIYLFGLITLSSGLSVFYNGNTFKFILFGVVNVILILFSVFVNRDVFLVFATIGFVQFLGRLSWEFYKNSVSFPFVLTIIGLMLIFSGVFFQKNRGKIEKYFLSKLPTFILNLRPKRNL